MQGLVRCWQRGSGRSAMHVSTSRPVTTGRETAGNRNTRSGSCRPVQQEQRQATEISSQTLFVEGWGAQDICCSSCRVWVKHTRQSPCVHKSLSILTVSTSSGWPSPARPKLRSRYSRSGGCYAQPCRHDRPSCSNPANFSGQLKVRLVPGGCDSIIVLVKCIVER